MYQSVSDVYSNQVEAPLRAHLITMLDHVLWLTQWSATVAELPGKERQALDEHLAELDAQLRNVLAHPVVRQGPSAET